MRHSNHRRVAFLPFIGKRVCRGLAKKRLLCSLENMKYKWHGGE